jgi:tetratricopeptide (TPR) repeat protein
VTASPVLEARQLTAALRDEQTVNLRRVVRVVSALRQRGRNKLARELAEAALDRSPRSSELWAVYAEVAAAAGRPKNAVPRYRKAIGFADEPAAKWFAGLAEALQATGAPDSEVDEVHEAAIRARPSHGQAVNAWVLALQSRGLDEAACDRKLTRLQRSVTEPLPALLFFLLAKGLTTTVPAGLEGHVARFLDSESAAACRGVWQAYNSLRPLDRDLCQVVRSLPPAEVQLFFAATDIDHVPIGDLLEESPAMRWFAEDFLAAEPEGAREFVTPTAAGVVRAQDPFLAWQLRAVRERRLSLRDPRSGLAMDAFDGVRVYGRSVYSFGGDELTLLICGGEGNKAIALYQACERRLVNLGADLDFYISMRRMANLLGHLLVRVAQMPEQYEAALTARQSRGSARRVTALVGSAENFAHHLWNYYTGFDRIIEAGLAGHVDEIHYAGTQFFGPVEHLFPEFTAATFLRSERQPLRDPHPFSADHLVVQPGGYFIPRRLAERVVAAMREYPRRDPGHLEPTGSEPFPVVWIGLRVGSRSWVDQEHQVPLLIDALHERFPEGRVLLDGYSYPVGRDHISAKWAESIERLKVLSKEIHQRVRHRERVVDMVGNTLRESVLWASVVDVYLTPVGTSQHKVGWFAPGHGLMYGPQTVMDVPRDRRPGGWESEGRSVPGLLVGTTADQGQRRTLHDSRRHLDNVRLDVDSVVQEVLALVDQRRSELRG